MRQLNKKQCIVFCEAWEKKGWDKMNPFTMVRLQLYQNRMCTDFNMFHKNIEIVLDRPVWTHEFAWCNKLRKELEGKKPKATLSDIINLLPKEKTIILYKKKEKMK